jgi:hypothetical protein
VIHLALPRDLSVFVVLPGWIWLGFWTSAKPDLYRDVAGVLMGWWLGVEPKPSGLERFRNGWTFAVATVLAVGLTWLCVFVSPYWWLT